MHGLRIHRPWFAALALGLALAVGLAACDDDSGRQSTKHRSSTTSSSKASAAGSSSTSSTTLPADPSAGATTTVPVAPGTCGAQTTTIVAAVQGEHPEVATGYQLQSCTLAPSSPTWALVRLGPSAGSAAAPRTVALERVGALWTVRAFGTDANVCDGIPAGVGAELLGAGCRG